MQAYVSNVGYSARQRRQINTDVNGAYNIITKVVPDAFSNGRVGVAFTQSGLPWRTGDTWLDCPCFWIL